MQGNSNPKLLEIGNECVSPVKPSLNIGKGKQREGFTSVYFINLQYAVFWNYLETLMLIIRGLSNSYDA